MGLWIRWELRTWFERGAKRGCFGHLLYTVKCGPDLWRTQTSCSQYPLIYRRSGMTNSLKQTQAANATKNPNTQKSIIVEALYGLLGNGCRRGFDASSFASSNSIWSRSA